MIAATRIQAATGEPVTNRLNLNFPDYSRANTWAIHQRVSFQVAGWGGGAMARARCLTDSSNFNGGSFQSRTNGYTNPVPGARRGGLMRLTGRIRKL